MHYLETKREAAERRRVALMSRGISDFLEKTSRMSGPGSAAPSPREDARPPGKENESSSVESPIEKISDETGTNAASKSPKEHVLDKIRLTLDHAAAILRDSLELVVGGVVFLDTAIGHTDTSVDAGQDTAIDMGNEVQRSHDMKIRKQSENGRLRPSFSSSDNQIGRHLSQGSTRDSTDKHKASKVQAMSVSSGLMFL